jgi:hypothetical protein
MKAVCGLNGARHLEKLASQNRLERTVIRRNVLYRLKAEATNE